MIDETELSSSIFSMDIFGHCPIMSRFVHKCQVMFKALIHGKTSEVLMNLSKTVSILNDKYFILFLATMASLSLVDYDAYGLWVPLSPEELLEQSLTIFVGTVTAVSPVDVDYLSQIASDGTVKDTMGPETMTLEEYTIEVEEFLKNPQETDTLKVLQATVGGVPGGPARISGFEIGDRVLFYLPKDEGQTHFAGQYLPESFKIPTQCDSRQVLEHPRIEGRNSFEMLQDGITKQDNFTAGMPIEFVYKRDMGSLDGASFDFQITVRKKTEPNMFDDAVLSEKIHAKSNSCEWIAVAKAELVPQTGNYRTWIHITEGTGGNSFSSSFSVNDYVKEKTMILPLKQFQSGIILDEIQCNDDLVLVQKYDGSPACVKPESKQKLMDRGWITNNENTPFEVISPESPLAKFYVQPQLTSIILKQDSTVRVHLFSYIKESDEWQQVFDRVFDEVPKNFKIGIVENTDNNINEFVTLGKENPPSGIKTELSRDGGYFVVYLTSNQSLEPGRYDLSVVSIDKTGAVIQKPLFVIAMMTDTTPGQDNTVKLHYSKYPMGIDLENISEQEYWTREDKRSPWPPLPILDITQDNIHPDVKEMIDAMWSQDAKYIPSEYDKKILLVENNVDLNVNPQKIREWLETTYVQQFKRNLDDSFSSYVRYDDRIYSFGFVIAD